MPRPIRLRDQHSHNALTLHRRAPRAAVLTFALMLTPCLTHNARAADINRPVVTRGYVATDSTVICTFWSGLGVETPFLLTDDYGRPVSWRDWMGAVNSPTIGRFFDGLDGLIFLASKEGQDWLRSDAGQAWAHSPEGRDWIGEFIKGAPAEKPVEYVRVCDVYGTGYFYIPGTETCLKLGGYVRSEVQYTDYDALRSGLQSKTSSSFSPEELQNLARTFGDILETPSSSSPQQDTNQQAPTPAPNGQTGTKQDDPGWGGKIRIQRDFGDGGGTVPAPQTPQKDDSTTSTNDTKTSSSTTPQADAQSNIKITVRIFVKGHVPEGSPVGPAIPDRLVSLVGGNAEPDLPATGTARTAEQENVGSDKGAPQGKSDANGVAKFDIDYGDMKYLMGKNYFRGDLKLTANYTFNGTVDVQKHGGFVAPAPDNTALPDFSKGYLNGVTLKWGEFTIGPQKFWDVGYSSDYTGNPTADQVKEDINKTLRDEFGPNINVTFDGNICRVELPARVTGTYTPVPQTPTAGIPEATIRLGLAARSNGGAP